MIDRIKFQIKDVDFDELEKRLDLVPVSHSRRTEASVYGATLKNISVTFYSESRFTVNGSLHKYSKGNNFSLFTYKEAKEALIELSIKIGIPLDRFIATNIELGVNMQMNHNPMKYLGMIHSYKTNYFIPMTPLSKTSKIKGCRCKFSEYEIKFYDKTFEAIHSGKIKVADRIKIPENILRFEISLSRKQLIYEGFKNVTGKNLLSNLHYVRFKKLLNRIFNDLIIKDISIIYTDLLREDVKKYIFAMSESYRLYLDYLKEIPDELEYRKELRSKNALLKKIDSKTIGEFREELFSKFTTALSKI